MKETQFVYHDILRFFAPFWRFSRFFGLFELKSGLQSSIATVPEPVFSVFRAKMLVYFLRFYDKSIPSAEAVQLFDDFLVRLAERKLQVFVISGNHDSPERIAFGSRIMDASGIHLSPVYDGKVMPITLSDEFGDT